MRKIIAFTIILILLLTKRRLIAVFDNPFSYVFNICRDVVAIPRDGTGGGACDSTIHDTDKEGHDIPETRKVPAFRVSNTEADCNRVSSPIDLGNYNWQLYGTFTHLN